jgi:hypothetical protein
MKRLTSILLCLSLTWFAIAKAVTPAKAPPAAKTAGNSAKKHPTTKADAKTLLHDARKALAAMVKDARADKALDPSTAKNKPFWKSTQSVAKNLKTADKGLSAKTNDFFKGVEGARKAGEELKVNWQLTDSKNKAVIDSGRTLDHALSALRQDFSKEAARKKKGGPLTAEEKAAFEKIKAKQKELLGKIDKLQASATKDKALEKGLSEIEKQANKIVNDPVTLDTYLAALYLLDVQAGLIRGYQYYVDKDWRDDYGTLVNYADWYDTYYYEWADPASYDWVYTETPVEVYEDIEVDETLSDADIDSQDDFVANEKVDMTDAEEDEVAAEEDSDEDAAADDNDSMEDDANDDGVEDSADDEGLDNVDDGADDSGDDGGDDSGDDEGDGGGDEG